MLSLLALLLSSSAFAVPIQFNHQGRLLDDSGEGLTGQHQLTFTFFDDPDNGYSQWTETLDATFTNGYYSVFLGMDEEGNPLDDSVFAGHPLWLELSVGNIEISLAIALIMLVLTSAGLGAIHFLERERS